MRYILGVKGKFIGANTRTIFDLWKFLVQSSFWAIFVLRAWRGGPTNSNILEYKANDIYEGCLKYFFGC
jgi:hypothetical protein